MITYLSTLEQVVKDVYFNDNIKLEELREQIVNDISRLETKLVIANTSNVISIWGDN